LGDGVALGVAGSEKAVAKETCFGKERVGRRRRCSVRGNKKEKNKRKIKRIRIRE